MSDASTKKRERIMMAMAGLAIIYLLITFLLPSGKKETQPSAGLPTADLPTTDLFTTISESLAGLSNQETEQTAEVLALAATPWKDAPFSMQKDFATDTANDSEQAPTALSYSGYMGMGKGQLAIINGMDYQLGETVEGFVLKEITPDDVLLEKNGTGVRLSIQAPME